MAESESLAAQIHRQFATHKQQLEKRRDDVLAAHQSREERAEMLEGVFNDLQKVWRPRLEAAAQEFGDLAETTPSITRGRRSAKVHVRSPLASIEMTFTASANLDVTELVLTYDLRILPVFMEFERHAELSMPIDSVDADRVGAWIDERVMNFVTTYLEMQTNQYYLKDHMVEDPVAGVRFPKFAAAGQVDWKGSTFYFISDDFMREYMKKNDIPTAPAT